MNWHNEIILRGVVSFSLLAGITPVWAGEAPSPAFPSTLTFEIFGDDDGQQDLHLSLDLALSTATRIQLDGGINQGGKNIENTSSILVGLGSDPGKDFSASIYYQIRNQDDAFTIQGMGVDMVLFHQDWMFFFAPKFRYITLHTSELVRRRRDISEIDLDSQGIEFGAGYSGLPNWGLSLYHRRDDYSEDLSRLERYPRLTELLFSQDSLNLAWGLDSSRTRFSATYYFVRIPVAIGGGVSSSSSAIDGSNYYTTSAHADWDINMAWGMTLNAGSADSDSSLQNSFVGIAVRYQW